MSTSGLVLQKEKRPLMWRVELWILRKAVLE